MQLACCCQTIVQVFYQTQILTASVPSPVDAFTWILKVQLDTLVNEASIPGHDYSPARVTCGHASDIEAFLPLLVDPFEREAI